MGEPTEPGRRARLRAGTFDEIKVAAHRELVAHGGDGLSLRSVARAVGMTPSALYRYFKSRDDLITTLVADGFDSLASALEQAVAESTAQQHAVSGAEQWLKVARAHRSWALTHLREYDLVCGSLIAGYERPRVELVPILRRGVDIMLNVMVDAINGGYVDCSPMESLLTPELRASLETWAEDWQIDLPPAALALCLHLWTQLHGFITLEIHGHYPPYVTDLDALFDQQMVAAVPWRQLPAD